MSLGRSRRSISRASAPAADVPSKRTAIENDSPVCNFPIPTHAFSPARAPLRAARPPSRVLPPPARRKHGRRHYALGRRLEGGGEGKGLRWRQRGRPIDGVARLRVEGGVRACVLRGRGREAARRRRRRWAAHCAFDASAHPPLRSPPVSSRRQARPRCLAPALAASRGMRTRCATYSNARG